ncbi:hypothetical protein F2Q70_00020242 [Brassica cretica]|uniref:Uncharacterized protein n=1 Tax=Brassica cretica TaxID=69181 RepID=A0A8S9GRL9_BRACR|nr:hypothetical protein F2Q70_00020242 [Brassica cretica]
MLDHLSFHPNNLIASAHFPRQAYFSDLVRSPPLSTLAPPSCSSESPTTTASTLRHGLWEHLSDEAAVEIVLKHPRTGIARKLVRAALEEAARKREMRYGDIKKIAKGVRRHFHDDISVVVVYLDQQKTTSSSNDRLIQKGGITAPPDIYSLRSDEAEQRRLLNVLY